MENLKEMLIEKGYKEGNNCYYLNVDDTIFYFNQDDTGKFTTVSVEHPRTGGQMVVIYNNADIDALEELEADDYALEGINIEEFINEFVKGTEAYLENTNKITLYVDSELANYLDINTEDILDTQLDNVMDSIVLKLIAKGYGAYKSSSNQITVAK